MYARKDLTCAEGLCRLHKSNALFLSEGLEHLWIFVFMVARILEVRVGGKRITWEITKGSCSCVLVAAPSD